MLSLIRKFFLSILVLLLSGCWDDGGVEGYYQGYMEVRLRYISSPVSGELVGMKVRRGSEVNKGAVLYVLDEEPEHGELEVVKGRKEQAKRRLEDLGKGERDEELSVLGARLEEAVAKEALGVKELARAERLLSGGGGTRERVDEARTELEVLSAERLRLERELVVAKLGGRTDVLAEAQARVKELVAEEGVALWKLSEKVVDAPVAGRVFDTYYEEGEFVVAGKPVVSLMRGEDVYGIFYIGERALGALQVGASVMARIDGIEEMREGRVSYISPEAEYTPPVIYSRKERGKLVYRVEVEFDDEDARLLHPGQPVEFYLKENG